MKEVTGTVFNIQRFSTHDGPGIRTTVFLKGCPLACPWCHNPESRAPGLEIAFNEGRCIRCGSCVRSCKAGAVENRLLCVLCGACVETCPTGARQLVGRTYTADELVREVEKDRDFYEESGGGVTFSGGEPLLQARFLVSVLAACRARELHTAVDTTGFAPTATLREVARYANLFLYDLKLMDQVRHREYTGVSNELILGNLRQLVAVGAEVIVRVPLIPGITDTDENLSAIGEFVQSLGLTRVSLLPFHEMAADKHARLGYDYRLPPMETQSESELMRMQSLVARHCLSVSIGA